MDSRLKIMLISVGSSKWNVACLRRINDEAARSFQYRRHQKRRKAKRELNEIK